MAKAGYVFNQVRALLDDPEGQFATDDYLTPFLQSAQDDFTVDVLDHANLGRMKFAVTLPGVVAGVQSLSPYFADGQSLALLEQVIVMREKASGAAEYLYSLMSPSLTPQYAPTGFNFNGTYTFTGQDILLPGANQALDIQVYGSFKPAVILSAETPLVLGTEAVLKYGTLAAVCAARGASSRANNEERKKNAQRGSLFNNWIMQQQLIKVRCQPFRSSSQSPVDSMLDY